MGAVEQIEHAVKGRVFGCQMCGQGVLHSTGLTCPMTCPKTLRNGPCGRADEVRRQLAPMQDWLDAVNATDNPAAHAHASPLAVAIALKQCGVEPVMQLVCRDRNRLALQSEIVGAAMHGIENLLALTGDDVTDGDEPQARAVFDLSGTEPVGVGRTLSEGRSLP